LANREPFDAKQEDTMKRVTSIAAAAFMAAFLTGASTASAQDSNVNQRTFLTFSGAVQMPGVTLPAGKYLFRLADTSLHNVMQVFDADEKNVMGQWFFIPKNRTTEELSAADGKPVVTFREMPEGTAPAVRYFFYPTDLTGKEFIYPKDQAVRIAAATHESVLATDSDASKGGAAHIFRVDPNGAEAAYDPDAAAGSDRQSASTGQDQPAAPSTAAVAPTDDNKASTQTAATSGSSVPEPTSDVAASQSSASQSSASQSSVSQSGAPATSGASSQAPAPRQQASAQLPKTASPFQWIGLIGLIALVSGFGLRFARSTY